VIAEENQETLSVEFIERVFMKSARAYKSVVYEGASTARGFWVGRAIDKQITGPKELSDYWIRDFLMSELRTTGPAGTRRIAIALRDAIRSTTEVDVRQQLVAAATLLSGQHGRRVTGRDLVTQLGLSDSATTALESTLPRPELMQEAFEFDREEFRKHVMYRSVELDNGAMLMAEDARFGQVFSQEVLDQGQQRVRFATEGRVVDQRLRRTR
jgi:hypothetical protein